MSRIGSLLGYCAFFVACIAVVYSDHPDLRSFVGIILVSAIIVIPFGFFISIFVYEKDTKKTIVDISTLLTYDLTQRAKKINMRTKEIDEAMDKLQRRVEEDGITPDLSEINEQLDKENVLLSDILKKIRKIQMKIWLYRRVKPNSLDRVANVFHNAAVIITLGIHYKNFDFSLWCYSTKMAKWRAKVCSASFPNNLKGIRFNREQWTGSSCVEMGIDTKAPTQFLYYDVTTHSEFCNELNVNRVEAEALVSDFKRFFFIRPSSYPIPNVVTGYTNTPIRLILVVRSRLDEESQTEIFGPQEDIDTDKSTLDDSLVYILANVQRSNEFLFTYREN